MKMFHTTLLSFIITGIACVTAQSSQTRTVSFSSSSSLKCLDVQGSNFQAGTDVEIADCDDSTAQVWEISSSLGTTTDVVVASQTIFCMDAETAVGDGSTIVINPCNGSPSQNWIFTSSGYLQLSGNTALCLQGGAANGDQVRTNRCNGAINQVWSLKDSA